MPKTPDLTQLATSFVPLIQRFTGNQPDALGQLRRQIENERDSGKQMVERAEAQLAALDQLEALIAEGEGPEAGALSPSAPFPPPPLKTAFLRILNEDPSKAWDREALYVEVIRRGWGPGGVNPRNTLTSRLRDLEREKRVKRIGRDTFASIKNDGALGVR
jgi:ABC-type transporter Mla subunit MlaD